MTSPMLSVRHSGAPLGHLIEGVDLSRPLDDATTREIDRLWAEHGVIRFSGQTLTPEQQIAFSRRFGSLARFPFDEYNHPAAPEIMIVSNVIENGRPIGMADAGRYWHTDMWYVAKPPRGSILYALEVPERDGVVYGDTLFTSMAAAYDALPADLQARLDGRTVVFSYQRFLEARRARKAETVKGNETAQSAREQRVYPDIGHPLVRRHPITGRKSLYLSEGSISAVEGMDAAESEPLIEMLLAHVIKPEFVYHHRWTVGDVVMWDNCSCMHNAIGDFALPLRRRMHRTTVNAA